MYFPSEYIEQCKQIKLILVQTKTAYLIAYAFSLISWQQLYTKKGLQSSLLNIF